MREVAGGWWCSMSRHDRRPRRDRSAGWFLWVSRFALVRWWSKVAPLWLLRRDSEKSSWYFDQTMRRVATGRCLSVRRRDSAAVVTGYLLTTLTATSIDSRKWCILPRMAEAAALTSRAQTGRRCRPGRAMIVPEHAGGSGLEHMCQVQRRSRTARCYGPRPRAGGRRGGDRRRQPVLR